MFAVPEQLPQPQPNQDAKLVVNIADMQPCCKAYIDTAIPAKANGVMHNDNLWDSIPPAPVNLSLPSGADSEDPSKVDYTTILAEVDSRLDAMSEDPTIIPAPLTSNPLLASSGTILFQALGPTTEPATYFTIHKQILYINSHVFFAHANANKHAKVFRVAADKHTLGRVVSWFYYPKEFDLTDFSDDELLDMMAVALDIRIPKLHDAIVTLLVDRHTSSPAKFKPLKDCVRLVYEKSKEGDGARRLCAYLLALGGPPGCKEDVQWEQELQEDWKCWNEKQKVSASAFFMKVGKGAEWYLHGNSARRSVEASNWLNLGS